MTAAQAARSLVGRKDHRLAGLGRFLDCKQDSGNAEAVFAGHERLLSVLDAVNEMPNALDREAELLSVDFDSTENIGVCGFFSGVFLNGAVVGGVNVDGA